MSAPTTSREKNHPAHFSHGKALRSRSFVVLRKGRSVTWEPTIMPTTLPVERQVGRALVALQKSDETRDSISRATHANVQTFIRTISTADTTYPSVVPDDDGVAMLHWVAGDFAVQIDIDATGPTYLWSKRGIEPAEVITNDASAIAIRARTLLASMAQRVADQNPHWRSLYNRG